MSTVTLENILEARERRQQQQQEMLELYNRPLVSFTINMPGNIKVCPASRSAFDAGLGALRKVLAEKHWNCHEMRIERTAIDQFALLAISFASAKKVKQVLLDLEESHPVGRLFDMDVVAPDGQILSRTEFGNSVRKCMLCEEPAVICAREQRHDVSLLRSHIEKMVAANQ